MSKKIAIEARITDYFSTEPLAGARTLLAVVGRIVAQRINAEEPQPVKQQQRKKAKPAQKREEQVPEAVQ